MAGVLTWDLPFDHNKILETAVARLRAKVRYAPIGFNLLPSEFTLSALQRLYEGILGKSLDKRNFRKKILSMGILKPVEAKGPRGAALYKFDEAAYNEAVSKGFNFDI